MRSSWSMTARRTEPRRARSLRRPHPHRAPGQRRLSQPRSTPLSVRPVATSWRCAAPMTSGSPDKLEWQAEAISAHPEADVLCGHAVLVGRIEGDHSRPPGVGRARQWRSEGRPLQAVLYLRALGRHPAFAVRASWAVHRELRRRRLGVLVPLPARRCALLLRPAAAVELAPAREQSHRDGRLGWRSARVRSGACTKRM